MLLFTKTMEIFSHEHKHQDIHPYGLVAEKDTKVSIPKNGPIYEIKELAANAAAPVSDAECGPDRKDEQVHSSQTQTKQDNQARRKEHKRRDDANPDPPQPLHFPIPLRSRLCLPGRRPLRDSGVSTTPRPLAFFP
jgi:hypothetical protein